MYIKKLCSIIKMSRKTRKILEKSGKLFNFLQRKIKSTTCYQ